MMEKLLHNAIGSAEAKWYSNQNLDNVYYQWGEDHHSNEFTCMVTLENTEFSGSEKYSIALGGIKHKDDTDTMASVFAEKTG